LPATAAGPLPSSGSLDDTTPELSQWHINGLVLEMPKLVPFFIYLHQNPLPPTVRWGVDGRYWQTAFSFLLELLARQLYRPTLTAVRHKKATQYEARWQPVVDGEEEAFRLGRLAAAMPPVARADAADPAQTIPPRAILDSFLNHLADAAVRHWATRTELYLPASNDPASAWLRALYHTQATVKASEGQMAHFASSFQAWERTLTVAGDKHYRIALRLEAPSQQTEKEDAAWNLHYLLQARDDTSVLVPAGEVWKKKSAVLQALNRHFDRPQERLLTGLGYAARFFAPIQRNLQERNPAGVQLTADEAYTFLRQCAPQLQRAGFGLLAPPWWNKPGTKLGVRLKLSSGQKGAGAAVSTGHLALENLIDYRWQLALGGTALSRQEFEALVALKSPLVQIRGQWVQLDPEQIEAAIRFWQAQNIEGTLSLHEAVKLGLADEQQTHNGLSVEGVDLDDWLQSWLNQLQGDEKLALLPPPAGLHAQLRPYQQYGYSWLHFARRWGMGVILADDMGLGKTIQTLTMIQQLKEEAGGQLPAPILLVCPTSVVTNWELEQKKFTPQLQTMVHQGADRLRGEELIRAVRAHEVVLTSYALVRRDGEALQQVDWYGVALDEAQNIKNAQTKQAQTIRQLPAQFRLALTGTPVENRLSELWAIMHFLNPGFLGSQKQFQQKFTLPIEKYGDETAAHQLRRMTRPFLLRRVKTDPTVIQDLPDKQETKVYCQLTAEQATLYEAVVQDALKAIEAQEGGGIARKGLVLSMLMQLKQVCNHPAQYLHEAETYNPLEDQARSGKLARLTAILEEVLAEGDKLLIFSQFTEMAGMLEKYLQHQFGVPTLYLHGGVPAKKRAGMVAQFQREDGPPIFLLSLKAGGTGLNLTKANHVFHFDRWWNPAVEDQATDRAFRIGQTKNVLVHKFVCLGTLEERIDVMLGEKKALAESVIGGGENWLTEMSTADLRQLVQLRVQ
jgi:SNF2 family DNA or RNA helicase